MYFFVPAVRTGSFKYGIFTYVPPAAPAVITAHTERKLAPAIPTEFIVGFGNIFSTVDTDPRPKKLIETAPYKIDTLFYLRRLHLGNYTNFAA